MCIHHIIFIQYKSNPITIYIIFTINILHFCFRILKSTMSVVLHVEADSCIYFTSHWNRWCITMTSLCFFNHSNIRVEWKSSLFWKLFFVGAFKDHQGPLWISCPENLCMCKSCCCEIKLRRRVISRCVHGEKFFFAPKNADLPQWYSSHRRRGFPRAPEHTKRKRF